MLRSRNWVLYGRWSLITAILVGLFWLMYYVVTGDMPVVSAVKLTKTLTIVSPWTIPRYWDVLIGPIFCFAIYMGFRGKNTEKSDNTDSTETITVIDNVKAGLIVSLLVCCIVSISMGLISFFAFGLILGSINGLVFGLIIGLGCGLMVGMVIGLVTLLNLVSKSKFWQPIRRWLTVSNE